MYLNLIRNINQYTGEEYHIHSMTIIVGRVIMKYRMALSEKELDDYFMIVTKISQIIFSILTKKVGNNVKKSYII